MKIILESEDDKIEISQKITNIQDVFKLLKRALIGIGFSEETIKEELKKVLKNEN